SLGEGPVATWFRRWRVGATVFCGASLLLALPALRCVGRGGERGPFCAAWGRPPRELHRVLHPSVDPATLGDAATVGLLVYGAYLAASVARGMHGARPR
ncbi:MAG: DUF3177 domain-containing protein, partial [Bacteroidetes bacterium QH_2_63_10]